MTCSKSKLREILFDLSVQMHIEGYEKHDPKRPIPASWKCP